MFTICLIGRPLFPQTHAKEHIWAANNKQIQHSSAGSLAMASVGRAREAPSPIAGKGLFATEDIKPGELIFTVSRPAVAALDTARLDTVCSNCFASAAEQSVMNGSFSQDVTVKACTGCKTMRYCSKVRRPGKKTS